MSGEDNGGHETYRGACAAYAKRGIATSPWRWYTSGMAASSHKFRWGDALLIGLATVIVILLTINAYGGASEQSYALVRNGDSTWRFPLDKPLHANIPGLMGDTVIHISDGKISIEDSPCPTKSCTTMGGISRKGQWLVCMPNGVFITIEGASEETGGVDDVSG